jgi:hypothetical protein
MGPTNDSTAKILRQLLIDLNQGVDTVGPWPVKAGLVPDSPDDIITTYGTSGLVKGRSMPDGEYQDYPGWQIAVRGTDHETAGNKIDSIKIALDEEVASNVVHVGPNRYIIQNVSRSGTPMYAGKEPNTRRFLFTLNGTMTIRMKNP